MYFEVYAALPKEDLIKREHKTKIETLRTPFERDRDRILHSKAFRRLSHKSQIFIYYYGDHHRTRLTHTIEVESIACSIAALLRLNTFLTSAIALSHDLGAPPFGKSGEDALNSIMKKNKLQGFYHNHQGVRVVELLEKQYPDYKGLNLTLAIREGILKHRRVGANFLDLHSAGLKSFVEENRKNIPSTLEAQAVKISDDITQTYHYIEDGLRYNLIPKEEILKSALWVEAEKFMLDKYKVDFKEFLSDSVYKKDEDVEKLTICRFLIKFMVQNLIMNSKKMIDEIGKDKIIPGKIKVSIVKFDEKTEKIIMNFNKEFISKYIYKNRILEDINNKCCATIGNIFNYFMKHPNLLPKSTLELFSKAEKKNGNLELRVLADHISGMTDRYAIKIWRDFFDLEHSPLPIELNKL